VVPALLATLLALLATVSSLPAAAAGTSPGPTPATTATGAHGSGPLGEPGTADQSGTDRSGTDQSGPDQSGPAESGTAGTGEGSEQTSAGEPGQDQQGTGPDCQQTPNAPGCDQTGTPRADPCQTDDQTSSPRADVCGGDPVDGISACLDVPVGADCAPFIDRYGRDCAAATAAPWCDEYGGLLLAECVGGLGAGACEPARPGLARYCGRLALESAEAASCTALGLRVGPAPDAPPAQDQAAHRPEDGSPGVSSPTGPTGPVRPAEAVLVSSPSVDLPGPGAALAPAELAGPGAPVALPRFLAAAGNVLAAGTGSEPGAGSGAVPAGGADQAFSAPTPTPTATVPAAGAAEVGTSSTWVTRPGAVEVLAAGAGGGRTDARLVARGEGGPLLGWPEVLATVLVLAGLQLVRTNHRRRLLRPFRGRPSAR
jgi:hypothetical protein